MDLLVSGYYGFGNLGDEALLAGLIGELEGRGHRVTVLSGNPYATEQLHGVKACHRIRDLIPALFRTDALISGGGGLLQDKTSRRSLHYYLAVLRLARIAGKPGVVYAQSIGPLSEAGKKAVVRALQGLPVCVRDEASRDLLASFGITAELAADPALLLAPPSAPENPIGPVLLIPRGGYPEITRGLIELARALSERGIGIAGLALHEAEDELPLEEIKRAVPALERLRADSPQAALYAISHARTVISARLHGLILAAVTHRRFSGIVYDPKVAAFLGEVGARRHTLPLDLALLLSEALEPVPVGAATVAQLKARAAHGLDWLDGVLKARHG